MSENSLESESLNSDDCERLLERLSSKGDTIVSCFCITIREIGQKSIKHFLIKLLMSSRKYFIVKSVKIGNGP